jgi:hypothetical protein
MIDKLIEVCGKPAVDAAILANGFDRQKLEEGFYSNKSVIGFLYFIYVITAPASRPRVASLVSLLNK